MRLIKIKLAGFKSFVDPTTLIIPSNLVGIVGPNGCGKSNIIDAVTWVMGESSAKHLRGDALTDVIFSGSASRQPVGQASVELVFDNTDGKLGGEYASYSEISIKRQMSREGVSTYQLNGSRCRRRDIQAIFLGTGLGPRSYAIIEQGVISRLIEAKPDELRNFIEEAAGISKYRERRRETENRIRNARENIDRLSDIREELAKQLNHLQRQARAAKRYQVLKQQERQLKAELLALNWQDLNGQNQARLEEVRGHENLLEQGFAQLRHIEADIEKQRDELHTANEILNQSQSSVYQNGADISQTEQALRHTQERLQSLQADLDKVRESEAAVTLQRQNDQAQLQMLSSQAGSLEPKLQGSRSQSNEAYDSLDRAEQAMQSWQTEWDACNEAIANFSQQLEVDTTRLQHLESGIDEINARRQLLTEELNDIDTDSLQSQLHDFAGQLERQESTIQQARAELDRKQIEARKLRDDIHASNEKLSVKRSEHQKLAGKAASLEALQQDAAGNGQELAVQWLSAVGLEQAPRLAQQLTVDPEWTVALETVLGQQLQDICVDNIEQVAEKVADLKQGQIGFISKQMSDQQPEAADRFPGLLTKITSAFSLHERLAGVYIATDINNAMAMRKELRAGESVVTQDGIWLGHDWIRVNKQDEQKSGSLFREQQIQSLHDKDKLLSSQIKTLERQLQVARTALDNAEQEAYALQNKLHPQQEQLGRLHSRHAELMTRLEQAGRRMSQLEDELAELDTQQTTDRQESQLLRQHLQRTGSDKAKLDSQRATLSDLREHHRQSLEKAKFQWQTTHEQSHEIALQLESISSQRVSLEQAMQRSDIQISSLQASSDELNATRASTQSPLADLEQTLEVKLAERIQVEKALSVARDHMQSIESALRETEQKRAECEQQVQTLRDTLEAVRISAQEVKVRLQTMYEQIQAIGQQVEEILAGLHDDAEAGSWQERLDSVEGKIHRLGPINLAAIDEFNQLSERKNYLDSQNEDLVEALATLENAIKKIDRETRTRFKETFDKLNLNLKEMFPVLFGGGHAYLEMTGEDLLDTGVTIMAQPPGKRNSTIHLLSGGEKALTAVALVFAIFKLNPAPFCILDEVDAPLDDTNVARFSQLLAKMSAEVQFIFITHNKITMEIAQQLLGVTMYEAGVSRLVSVDMDEAVKMAATA